MKEAAVIRASRVAAFGCCLQRGRFFLGALGGLRPVLKTGLSNSTIASAVGMIGVGTSFTSAGPWCWIFVNHMIAAPVLIIVVNCLNISLMAVVSTADRIGLDACWRAVH